MQVPWTRVLAWGVFAAVLLTSLELIRLAPLWLGLGRELVGAAVAILAVAVGVAIARWWYAPGERERRGTDASDRGKAVASASPLAGLAAPQAVESTTHPPETGSIAQLPGLQTGVFASSPADAVSPREREVLALLAQGLSNKELARELKVSENTIKTHLANLYAKLGTRNRVQALGRARALGLIDATPAQAHGRDG
jgi:DNA-binding CsgD family transcriptional regulator